MLPRHSTTSCVTPPSRPEKNYALFLTDSVESLSLTAQRLFEGALGPLPLLLSVSCGYYTTSCDSLMYPYENEEILFAFKQDKQFRVLLRDSFQRTLSLPVRSDLTFCVEDGSEEEMTLSEVLSHHCLPVSLRLARPHELSFVVDREVEEHTFFGPRLLLTAVYDEPFYWCLSIQPHGKIRSSPRVLPRNLLDVYFTPVTGIRGATDPSAKLKEFLAKFSHFAQGLRCQEDPFFQDPAIVSKGPAPVHKVEPYIEEQTFVTVIRKSPGLPPGYLHAVHHPGCDVDLARRPARCRSQEELGSSADCCSNNGEDFLYEEPLNLWPSRRPATPAVSDGAASCAGIDSPPDSDYRSQSSCGSADGTLPGAVRRVFHVRSSSVTPPPVPPRVVGGLMAGSYVDLQRPEKEKPAVPAHRPVAPGGVSSDTGPEADGGRAEWSPRLTPPAFPPPPPWKDVLDTFSVDDLTVKLKELGLQKYRKKFRNARIDGVLLQKLSEDTLRKEFQINNLELIRLNAFIDDGHVPKSKVKRSRSLRTAHSR